MLFPDCGVPILTAGVIWEVVEELAGMFLKSNNGVSNYIKNRNLQYTESWWGGSISDILFNTAGFMFGKLIVQLFNLRIHIKGLN